MVGKDPTHLENYYLCETKGEIMLDTIAKPMRFHLEEPVENLSLATDSITGVTAYQLTFANGKKEVEGQSSWVWKGLTIGLLVIVFVGLVWSRKKRSKSVMPAGEDKEAVKLLRQSDAYKSLVSKGYYSVNRRTSLEPVNDQEISALCEVVIAVYTSFSALLQDKGLSDKDFQFCCLVKSGLSTFELAEIYCVSESAIFKRKQKLKEKLGFGSDGRTLDAIVREL
jgi:DNA-binding CsgD family transcriptional regulator